MLQLDNYTRITNLKENTYQLHVVCQMDYKIQNLFDLKFGNVCTSYTAALLDLYFFPLPFIVTFSVFLLIFSR